MSLSSIDFDRIAEAVSPDQLARALGAQKVRNGWRCPSPGHDDQDPSFSIFRDGNRTAGKCHGCGLGGSPVSLASAVWGVSANDAAIRLVRKLGIHVSSNGTNRAPSEIIDTYPYTDEDGELLFEVVRTFPPKDFTQRRPNGRGGWIWNLQSVRRVLYRLPQIIEAVALDRLIHVAEGERDVHAIEQAGGVATCNPMGAGKGKWREEYSEVLRGARVRIVADRDEAGRAHAQQVEKSLEGIAASVEVVEAKDGKDAADHLAAGCTLDEFEPLTEEATDEPSTDEDPTRTDTGNALVEAEPQRERPEIIVREELTSVTREAIHAISAKPDLAVYVRGRILVTVARDGSRRPKWLRRPQGAPTIVQIEEPLMLAILDEAAEWVKYSKREKDHLPARPPAWVASQILGRLEWPFRYLEAVIEAPTLRPDGSVLDVPGWDERTGLLFEPAAGVQWPSVPDAPSGGQVQAAVASLLDPVRDFPFVANSDKAAFVAAVLSLVARHLIDGPVPGFPIRAPTPGTGKTLLAELISIIGTGRVPPAMSMTYQTEELRKRIHALALDGTPLVLLENISGSLGSDVLAGALTAREWRDRVLGQTQMVEAPLQTVWLMTGNNLGFKRTLGRRVVPIDLDAKLETPEDRSGFTYTDVRTRVLGQRHHLAVAALTILRGFHLAGRPVHGGPRMGSFEAWDDLIRSAAIWANLDDPATTEGHRGRGRIRAQADDDLEMLGGLLVELDRLFDEEPFSTAQVLKKAKADDEFSAVLDAVATPAKGGHPTSGSVGAKFRDHKDRPMGGLVLRYRQRTWKVERLEEFYHVR